MMSTNVKFEEEYIWNEKGTKLFTCRWKPEEREPKALVFLCHGYAMETSISTQGMALRLAKGGYGVYGIDFIGHGKSDGLSGFIPNFDHLVQDCFHHFTKVCEKVENEGKRKFLIGKSMGGAVILLLHRLKPEFWDGAILVAPMCKIADDLKPSPLVVSILTKLTNLIPTWKIVPIKDIIDAAVRDPHKKKEVRSNPYWYKGRLRLKTGSELHRVSMDIEKRLDEVTIPFLVLHGGDDKVTDPAISKQLYESASSIDKTFQLYPGMWHALTYGELPENTETVFKDIIGWLDERSRASNARLERQRNSQQDKDVSTDQSM